MFLTRVLISLFEFALTVVMSVMVVYVNFKALGFTNTDYNEEQELQKNNVAVAILLAATMFASGLMVQKGIYPVVSLVRLTFLSPGDGAMPWWRMAIYALSHLIMSFVISILTISFALRFFGKLTKELKEGEELKKNNVAVGIILSSVVMIVAMYVSEGISSLSKALIPQPSIGRVQIMK